MIYQVMRFEVIYGLKSLPHALIFIVIAGLCFLMTANGGEFQATAIGGEVYANAPAKITIIMIALSVFLTFLVPSFMTDALLKDREHRFDSLLFSTPLSKSSYFFGRFAAGYLLLLLTASAVPIGLLLGSWWPWADPSTLGPTTISQYWLLYCVVMSTSLLVVAALLFIITAWTNKTTYVYLMALSILAIYILGSEFNAIPVILDPFLHEIFEQQSQYWTAQELNHQGIVIDNTVIINRLMWMVVTVLMLWIGYKRFPMKLSEHKKEKPTKKQHVLTTSKNDNDVLSVAPLWSFNTHMSQLKIRTQFEVVNVIKSKAFVLLMALSVLMLLMALTSRETLYGVDSYPLTYLMIKSLTGIFGMTLLAVVAFYSAEIIWRERDCQIHHIFDAMPAPNWVFIVSKLIALYMIMFSIMLLGVLIAIAVQLFSGYSDIDLGLYLHRGVIYPSIPFVFLGTLTVFFQVLTNHRYLGILLFALFIAGIVSLADLFGIQHPLLSFGVPALPAPLSEMNGNGRFIYAGYIQRLYWLFMAGLVVLSTYLWWSRGSSQPFFYRLHKVRLQFNTHVVAVTLVLIMGWFGSGFYVFYNTNIINEFMTEKGVMDLRYLYEKKYSAHIDAPMPTINAIDISVDIFPHKRRIDVSSTHTLKNKTTKGIDTVYVTFPPTAEITTITLNGAKPSEVDDRFNYYTFVLEQEMMPQEMRQLTFELNIQQQGFVHGQADYSLVENGSFIRNNEITPYIGFSPSYRITDEKDRKKYGLAAIDQMAKLDDRRHHHKNALRGDSDFIKFTATVSTSVEQTALAPGELREHWQASGRNYFRYESSQLMHNFYSILSASYEEITDQWQDVAISIYHHPSHQANLDRMIAAVKDSLTYYSKAFGPYPQRSVKIVEFPAYRQFAQAFAGLIPYSEAMGFVADVKTGDIDMPYYVTAHEVAHQWWGHQVAAADVQGQRFVQETLAQYSALMVMEKKYGAHQIRQFLKYELDKYLSERSEDINGEQPLSKVEKQSHIYYRKGAVVMYALKDYIGEQTINSALRQLISKRAYDHKPYVTSLDVVQLIKQHTSEDKHDLITDFLEKISIYDVKVDQAHLTTLADGRYQVEIQVSAAKFYADQVGQQTTTDFDIPVDIGLFSKHPSQDDFSNDEVLFIKKRHIDPDSNIITIITDQQPAYVGIDPFNKLIDRNSDDNIIKL